MSSFADVPVLKPLTVLCVTSADDDIGELQKTLRVVSSQLIRAFTCEQAVQVILANRMPVVICTESFGDSDWRTLLGAMEELSLPPSVIVLRSSPNPALWADVLMAGGFDVVCRPLQLDTLLSAVISGWQRWNRKREILAARERNLSSIHKEDGHSEFERNEGFNRETDTEMELNSTNTFNLQSER